MARGCGLTYYPMEGDYDCSHGYTWGCESCPIAITANDEHETGADLMGPPAPSHIFLDL